MNAAKKIFFASDLHLGAPSREASIPREKHFVQWLDTIQPLASELYLLGDVFDFWFEYKRTVPKGYHRLLGKLAQMTDSGIKVHFFAGNHDLWLGDYFSKELGIEVYLDPIVKEIFGKKFLIGHGDGLGPGDKGYKVLKKVFRNRFAQWSFHRLHPNFGIRLADFFSKRSRKKTGSKDYHDYGENEYLLLYSKEYLKKQPEVDYFVFGHRHFPKLHEFETGKFYVNLGDWIRYFSYLEVSGNDVQLGYYPMDSRV